ncbi:hypothetical protein BsWGS_10096 [Bradybaena similaris]
MTHKQTENLTHCHPLTILNRETFHFTPADYRNLQHVSFCCCLSFSVRCGVCLCGLYCVLCSSQYFIN